MLFDLAAEAFNLEENERERVKYSLMSLKPPFNVFYILKNCAKYNIRECRWLHKKVISRVEKIRKNKERVNKII